MVVQIVGKNPNTSKTPYHPVVKNDSKVCGHAFGVNKKTAIL